MSNIYRFPCVLCIPKQQPVLYGETFTDINGGKHRRYTVRKISHTFSPFDKYTNVFLLPNADQVLMTREQAWEYLRTTEVGNE